MKINTNEFTTILLNNTEEFDHFFYDYLHGFSCGENSTEDQDEIFDEITRQLQNCKKRKFV